MSTPLVLLHGVGLDHTMWHPFQSAFDHPTITYDLLGLGNAPKPAGPYRLSDYVDQWVTEMDSRGLDDAVDLVGFSMGALVAQAIALAYPERVRRLILVSGVFNRTPAERAAIVARVAEVRAGAYLDSIEPALDRWFSPAFAAAQPDLVGAVRQRMRTNDVAAYANAYEVFATGDAELAPDVRRITAPTLVITGADDQRSTPQMAVDLAATIPDAQVIIVPGARHLLPLETPDVLAGLISEFLELGRDER